MVDSDAVFQLEVQAKYAGYLARQEKDIAQAQQHEAMRIPDDFDYSAVSGLSTEIQGSLSRVRPVTLAQAKRIPGVTPAAISILLIYIKKHTAAMA